MAENNNNLIAVMSFVAGVAVGANWDKIKEKLGPMFSSIAEKGTKFMAEQKENVEDTIAAAKIAATKKSAEPLALQAETDTEQAEKIIVKKKKIPAAEEPIKEAETS